MAGRDPNSRFLHEDEYSVKNVSPAIRDYRNSSGAASGRGARFKALDAMIVRRQMIRREAAQEKAAPPSGMQSMRAQAEQSGSSQQRKGVLLKSGSGMSQKDIEDMIAGRKGRY